MSLIEIGETGSWLARFFEKTVGSYAKKPAELYYLSFLGFIWMLSSLTDNTMPVPPHSHQLLPIFAPQRERSGRLLAVTVT